MRSMRANVAPHPVPGDDAHTDLWRVLVRQGEAGGKDVARHFEGSESRRALRRQRLENVRRSVGARR